MNYRICGITFIPYDAVLHEMQGQAAEQHQSFNTLEKWFFANGFVLADSFTQGMLVLGNESRQILYNAEILQKRWAAENGISFRESQWKRDIAIAQLKSFRPDVVYIQGLHRDPLVNFVPDQEFRDACPFVKLVVAHSGFPMEPEVARFVDIILAGSPELCEYYRRGGARSEVLYHAFDERISAQIAAYQKSEHCSGVSHDFTFLGSTGYGWGAGHRTRYYDLIYLLASTPLEIWGYEPIRDPSLVAPKALARASAALRQLMGRLPASAVVKFFEHVSEECFGSANPTLPLSTLFPDRCQDPRFGVAMYDILARSRLTFNRHTDAGNGHIGNMRMFHATGLGACLVTDTGENIRELFEPDEEVVVYRSTAELVDKIQYLLQHDSERQSIADAGHKRTLRDHTYLRRCQQIHDIILRTLGEREALIRTTTT